MRNEYTIFSYLVQFVFKLILLKTFTLEIKININSLENGVGRRYTYV